MMGDDAFCRIAAHEAPAHFVYEDEELMAILDIHPVSRGQVLVMPKEHFMFFYEMPDRLVGRFYGLVNRMGLAMARALEPRAVVILARGLRVPHYHLLMIPTYEGDFTYALFRVLDAFQGFPPVLDGTLEGRLDQLREVALREREMGRRGEAELEGTEVLLRRAIGEVLEETPLPAP